MQVIYLVDTLFLYDLIIFHLHTIPVLFSIKKRYFVEDNCNQNVQGI